MNEISDYGFTLSVPEITRAYDPLIDIDSTILKSRQRTTWYTPLNRNGYEQLRFETKDSNNNNLADISSFILLYGKPEEDDICPADGDYPSVGEGETSTVSCGYGYSGFLYRICSQGTLGAINEEFCIHLKPENLAYIDIGGSFTLIKGKSSHIPKPTYDNIVDEFYLAPGTSLPDGLSLDTKTGEITGIPTITTPQRTYTIFAKNPEGETSTTISIEIIRKDRMHPCGEGGYKRYVEEDYSFKELENPNYITYYS